MAINHWYDRVNRAYRHTKRASLQKIRSRLGGDSHLLCCFDLMHQNRRAEVMHRIHQRTRSITPQKNGSLQPDNIRIQRIQAGKLCHPILAGTAVIDGNLVAARAIIADHVLEQPRVAIHLSRYFDDHPRGLHSDDIEYSLERTAMIILDALQQARLDRYEKTAGGLPWEALPK